MENNNERVSYYYVCCRAKGIHLPSILIGGGRRGGMRGGVRGGVEGPGMLLVHWWNKEKVDGWTIGEEESMRTFLNAVTFPPPGGCE